MLITLRAFYKKSFPIVGLTVAIAGLYLAVNEAQAALRAEQNSCPAVYLLSNSVDMIIWSREFKSLH